MKAFLRELLLIRSAEYISALAATYWLALSLLDQRIGNKLGSYRALTDVAPHYVWAALFAAIVIAQPIIAHRGAPGRQGFRLATSLLWITLGFIEAHAAGLVGPTVYLLWIIGTEGLRRAVADHLGLRTT